MNISILFPCVARKASGGHKVLYEYSNRLQNDNYNITIYYFTYELFTNKGIPENIRIPIVKLFGDLIGPRLWFPLEGKIKTHVIDQANQMQPADIIIATGIETVYPVAKLPKEYGEKLYFIQDYENWHVSDDVVTSSYNLGMKNIVVSNWLKEIVDQYSKSPSILISNGIDGNIFYPKNSVRNRHSIVFQYRKAENKGSIYALEAIDLLHKKYDDLNVSIISSDPKEIDLPSFCSYYYNQTAEEVSEINNKSEVFICSTIDEGFGLPGLEAMACGCAVCSTDYTGVHEYAVDDYNALLSPVRDPQAMADNVSRLFDDEELRKKIVTNGIKTGKEKSVDNSYQKFKKVLEDLVKKRP